MGWDIIAGLPGSVSGEVEDYKVLLAQARREAIRGMIEQAEEIGADAIVSTGFATSMMIPGASKTVAYGIAARLTYTDYVGAEAPYC